MPLALIGAPTSLGAFAPGQEQAPRALREAGLRADADFGDIALRRWRPDREHRRAQNAAGVAEAAREQRPHLAAILVAERRRVKTKQQIVRAHHAFPGASPLARAIRTSWASRRVSSRAAAMPSGVMR